MYWSLFATNLTSYTHSLFRDHCLSPFRANTLSLSLSLSLAHPLEILFTTTWCLHILSITITLEATLEWILKHRRQIFKNVFVRVRFYDFRSYFNATFLKYFPKLEGSWIRGYFHEVQVVDEPAGLDDFVDVVHVGPGTNIETSLRLRFKKNGTLVEVTCSAYWSYTLTIRVQIPKEPTYFSAKFVFQKNKNKATRCRGWRI